MASLRPTTSSADLFPASSSKSTDDGQLANGLSLGLDESSEEILATHGENRSEPLERMESLESGSSESSGQVGASSLEESLEGQEDSGSDQEVNGLRHDEDGMMIQMDSVMDMGSEGESDEGNSSQEVIMSDSEAGPSNGKRVKVYELRENSWYDRGTGHCRGVYDDAQDLAMLIVEAEVPEKPGEDEGEGGFLKDELLLSARVEKDDIYSRQQDTLIVWTEPGTNLDIALSFQDAEGCEDIWQFMSEVRRHLNGLPNELDASQHPSSSSPLSGSPVLGSGTGQGTLTEARMTWEKPSLANIKSQEIWLRMQTKSPAGRERAVRHIISEDYIKECIAVHEQAEDLESLDDLHALCSLMQTILLLNDNTVFEYILQDDMFVGVLGLLEYDPEFPTLKASYRSFFEETAKFRQVVEIRNPVIESKIHQTYRLMFLKDVVLARVLEDPTFGILNGFIFFNQSDIVSYMHSTAGVLNELFAGFKGGSESTDEPLDDRKRDIVLFLHQLMIMGKSVQLPNRVALYRNLLEKGLLYVCEWAYTRHEAQILHAGAELLSLAVEHDVNVFRRHCLQAHQARRRTLLADMIGLMNATQNIGLLSQTMDTLRSILDVGMDEAAFAVRKESESAESFMTYFYDHCSVILYQPLLDLPDVNFNEPPAHLPSLSRERRSLLQGLIELFSFTLSNQNQAHRAAYFLLSHPLSRKVLTLLYFKDKSLRHAALRYMRTCFKIQNHFIHRYFVKNDLLLPLLDLINSQNGRDNMLSSSYMEVLELVRKENIKPIINHLFENHKARLDVLASRPYLRLIIRGLTQRWEANNEPAPPPPPQPDPNMSSSKTWSMSAEADEENYFQASSDDEEIGPKAPMSSSLVSPQKRKRAQSGAPTPPPPKRPSAPSPGRMASGNNGSSALGLDYDDGSDSDGSSGAQSPVIKPSASSASWNSSETSSSTERGSTPPEELAEDLGDVAMKMRAKRLREEEEEEGFAGLLVKQSKKTSDNQSVGNGPASRSRSRSASPNAKGGSDDMKVNGSSTAAATDKESPNGGKKSKIRLSFGPFGRKAAGGGGDK
ncbi:component of IIS longevity pathway SMK-1-domain-containing protein [Kockovaella imperatae]|uniref:Component of IIS longevity pathway SMK-1-domain-containing protein n=1 Tax=Kockovaella imperatae TaxID=4999 RepID=A0A1Y1UBY2_9TREE|nr:component of IIS longevity pathway SMK-1-domain-containing protein [Kockovaella imperatae]ORX34996.1 component of IIS longevity pathway SMK-1-domain-containing protein [Kockovaella imperatae]